MANECQKCCPLIVMILLVAAYFLYAYTVPQAKEVSFVMSETKVVHSSSRQKSEGPKTESCKPTLETAEFVVGLALEVNSVEEVLSYVIRSQLEERLVKAAQYTVHDALWHTHKHKEKILNHQHHLVPPITVGKPVAEVLEELFNFDCYSN